MSVWFCCPSKRLPAEVEPVLKQWRERGYKIGLVVDDRSDYEAKRPFANAIIASAGGYQGYARSVNALVIGLIERNSDAEFFVCSGDDTLPDPHRCAEEIAQECLDHFEGVHQAKGFDLGLAPIERIGTFGVMQPTGDPWSDSKGRIIERIAGSPWIGREFARRMYGGAGPYWHEYTHCFVDEELQCVAQKLGVFWQRPDLTHMHNNWARPKHPQFPAGNACDMPDFLREANSPEHWAKYSAIFKARKEAGFPGHNPIP